MRRTTPNPRTRHFHAEITGGGCPCGASGQVSVEIKRYIWDVSLQSDKSSVTVPDSFTLTATLSRDVGATPYSVSIIDDDTGSSVGGCGSGTSCTVTVGTSYAADNPEPAHAPLPRRDHRWRLSVRGVWPGLGRDQALHLGRLAPERQVERDSPGQLHAD